MRRAFVCASICLAGVASTGLLWLARGKTDREQLAVNQVLGLLSERSPSAYDETSWGRLVAVVGEVLAERNVNALSRHHADMIAHTLELHAAEELPSQEKDAFEVEWLRWSLPRFLSDPPSAEETGRVLRQIDDLASFMTATLGEAAGREGLPAWVREDLSQWRHHTQMIAQTFALGTSLHPVSDAHLAAAKAAFSSALRAPDPQRLPKVGDRRLQEMAAVSLARGALWKTYVTASASPPLEDPPPPVARKLPAVHQADHRLMQGRAEANLQRFRAKVLAQELREEREDLEAWAVVCDCASLTGLVAHERFAGPSGQPWAVNLEVNVGERQPALVRASGGPDASLRLLTPRSAEESSSRWRWENSDVEVAGSRLALQRWPKGEQTWCDLGAPAGFAILHFDATTWAQALAGQVPASAALWAHIVPYLPRPSADRSKEQVGATNLEAPVGVFPFAATPAVVQVEKAQAGGPIRLLTTDGSDVGTLKCSYERSSGLRGLPSSLTLDLQPRTVNGSAVMNVRHGAEQPTQETWSAALPALTTDVTITFSARNGTPALESVQATDEKGKNVCTIQVSPRGSGG